NFAQTLARLLTEASASLFYHLLIGLALEGLLLMAAQAARRAQRNHVARRLALAAGLGLVGRIGLFGVAFVESRWLPSGTLLPPLERAIDVATWAWLGWAMLERAPGFWLPMLHTLIALGAYGMIAPHWFRISLQDPTLFYAGSPSDRAWTLWTLGVSLGMGGLLLSRPSPASHGVGALGFFALALGAFLQLNAPLPATHLSPWIRLGAMTAYPLWLAGAYRLALQTAQQISWEARWVAEGWRAWSQGLLRALREQEDPSPLDEALRAARTLLGARWTAVGLWQEDRLLIVAREGERLPQAGSDLLIPFSEYPPIGELLLQRRSGLLAPETQRGEAFRRLWQAFGMERAGFLQIEPLITSEGVLGLWLIGYPVEAAHQPPDPTPGQQMAGLLAQTLSLLREREAKAALEAALVVLQKEHEETLQRIEARHNEERQALYREINRWATRAAEAEEEGARWRRRAEELAQLIEAQASAPVGVPLKAASASPAPAMAPESDREGLILALRAGGYHLGGVLAGLQCAQVLGRRLVELLEESVDRVPGAASPDVYRVRGRRGAVPQTPYQAGGVQAIALETVRGADFPEEPLAHQNFQEAAEERFQRLQPERVPQVAAQHGPLAQPVEAFPGQFPGPCG
ncbi:MAG: hypothetical protein ACK4OK_06140, partial [Thermoflexus sp.]